MKEEYKDFKKRADHKIFEDKFRKLCSEHETRLPEHSILALVVQVIGVQVGMGGTEMSIYEAYEIARSNLEIGYKTAREYVAAKEG